MKKKVILGTFFVIVFFSVFYFFYSKSSYKKKVIEIEEKDLIENKKDIKLIEEKIVSSNIIQDVSYSARDTKGNEYFLKASEGTIDQNQSNFIFLKSVKAVIKLKDYELIEISSNFGKYNVNNYDTIFSKNVIITYLDNKIKGDYLDFSLDKKLMIISKDVIMKDNKNSLQADVIEVDIETKDFKIFMYEEDKRVNFKSLN